MDPSVLRKKFGIKIKRSSNMIIYTYTVNSYYRFLMYKFLFGADEVYIDNLF